MAAQLPAPAGAGAPAAAPALGGILAAMGAAVAAATEIQLSSHQHTIHQFISRQIDAFAADLETHPYLTAREKLIRAILVARRSAMDVMKHPEASEFFPPFHRRYVSAAIRKWLAYMVAKLVAPTRAGIVCIDAPLPPSPVPAHTLDVALFIGEIVLAWTTDSRAHASATELSALLYYVGNVVPCDDTLDVLTNNQVQVLLHRWAPLPLHANPEQHTRIVSFLMQTDSAVFQPDANIASTLVLCAMSGPSVSLPHQKLMMRRLVNLDTPMGAKLLPLYMARGPIDSTVVPSSLGDAEVEVSDYLDGVLSPPFSKSAIVQKYVDTPLHVIEARHKPLAWHICRAVFRVCKQNQPQFPNGNEIIAFLVHTFVRSRWCTIDNISSMLVLLRNSRDSPSYPDVVCFIDRIMRIRHWQSVDSLFHQQLSRVEELPSGGPQLYPYTPASNVRSDAEAFPYHAISAPTERLQFNSDLQARRIAMASAAVSAPAHRSTLPLVIVIRIQAMADMGMDLEYLRKVGLQPDARRMLNNHTRSVNAHFHSNAMLNALISVTRRREYQFAHAEAISAARAEMERQLHAEYARQRRLLAIAAMSAASRIRRFHPDSAPQTDDEDADTDSNSSEDDEAEQERRARQTRHAAIKKPRFQY